ncbi:MAG: glucose-6-phosphate dehydrogenase [Ktedonobacteraceae bacterium]
MTQGVQVANPLTQHSIWQEGHKPEPCAIVIFGATGDLAQRKLLPTLAHLMHDHPLQEGFCIVGYARRPMDDEQWRAMAVESINKYIPEDDRLDSEAQQAFAKKLFYCQANLDDDEGYHKLSDLLDKLDKEQDTKGNRIFYLSTPPELDPEIVDYLGRAGLAQPEWQQGENGHGWTRLIIEKPFGHDLASAQELNVDIGKSFREDQIFRIDHYMGKETVQNILAFRFANGIFEPLWNRNYIDHVQILVAESLSIGSRSEYYESEGAIRDMVQNHIMQALCLTGMEVPAAFDANAIRDEKVKLVRAIPSLTPEQVDEWTVRGQYTAGVTNGKPTVGYLEEKGVNPHSHTETFVALKLFIENWRWSEVPFYIRTGKCLPSRSTEVTIQFKRVPHQMYNPEDTKGLVPNRLTLRIQPDDGISLKFAAKIPGAAQHLASVDMNFSYKTAFGIQSPEAYERLIADCMLGDSTLFIRRDEIEASWRVIDSITKVWEKMEKPQVHPYVAGTWGPKEADALIEKDGREWDNPAK